MILVIYFLCSSFLLDDNIDVNCFKIKLENYKLFYNWKISVVDKKFLYFCDDLLIVSFIFIKIKGYLCKSYLLIL